MSAPETRLAVIPPKTEPGGDTLPGFLFALSAYLFWGFLPFYMKAVGHVPAVEVVAHRIVWSVPLAGLLLLLLRRTGDIGAALRSPRTLAMGALTASIITINWGVYVWAIAADRALETALGYYINPLFSIFLGAVVLGERLSRAQMAAIALAVCAVVVLTWEAGGLPWVSLALCISWGFYALFKKTLPIGPAQGFFLEVLLLTPFAGAYIVWLQLGGMGHFGGTGMADVWLLLLAGFITAVPLILYANGAKLLRLSTIGIMQYIAPTMIFLFAVFIFREPFSGTKLIAFMLIWSALAIYTWSMLAEHRAAIAKG
ncbi:MAG: EamA family transporter RarD [Rhizobiaceae bacterium]|nr:EamA family transporter RarD [Rhizobiaceae bacterium]MCV0408078.1 EamA family transporter RarD [Rhizobiaceae bacterium]